MSDIYQRLQAAKNGVHEDPYVRELAAEAFIEIRRLRLAVESRGDIVEVERLQSELLKARQLFSDELEKWMQNYYLLSTALAKIERTDTEPIGGFSAAFHRTKSIARRALVRKEKDCGEATQTKGQRPEARSAQAQEESESSEVEQAGASEPLLSLEKTAGAEPVQTIHTTVACPKCREQTNKLTDGVCEECWVKQDREQFRPEELPTNVTHEQAVISVGAGSRICAVCRGAKENYWSAICNSCEMERATEAARQAAGE